MLIQEVFLNVIVGIVAGIASGFIVYVITKKRDEKYRTYYYLLDYLYKAMEKIEIEIPSELLRYGARVGDSNSAWSKAFYNVIDMTRRYDVRDYTYSEEEATLAENIVEALDELNSWGQANHLFRKHDRK